jgi:putative hydrolase of the HAD superfamily
MNNQAPTPTMTKQDDTRTTTDQAINRTITAVLFDMDNTLFDFVEAKIAACREVNRILGLDRPMELLRYFIRRESWGFEHWNNIRDFMNDNGVYSDVLYARCCQAYEETKIRDLAPYPGIESTLLTLKEKGLSLSVVTDAQLKNAVSRLEKTGLHDIFDEIITADLSGSHKPDPKVFCYALERLGRPPSEVLMVGDSLIRDIGPAKRMGMMTAYASYGDRNFHEDQVEEADLVLRDIRELLGIFV